MSKTKDGQKSSTKQCAENVISALIDEQSPDIICLQEVRCNDNVDVSCLNLPEKGYQYVTFNCSVDKKGYSGTATFSKLNPLSTRVNFAGFDDRDELNREGRLITLEFDTYYVVTAYVPNSKPDLSRLGFRISVWEQTVQKYIQWLQRDGKRVILCGDLNVAADKIDVHNPTSAKGKHGFTEEERTAFATLLKSCSLIDSFRYQHPRTSQYSWYSPFAQSRQRGVGWRIDYILVSDSLKTCIKKTSILSEYYGSDHVPCFIDIDI
jgi:exodeoxyribonuclease-3